MNNKLKFNLSRLKLDFDAVVSEMEEEIRELQGQVDDSYSEDYVDDLEEQIKTLTKKNDEQEEEIERLTEYNDKLIAEQDER